VVFGETMAGTTALILAVIALGVVLAAAERAADPASGPRLDPGHNRQAALFAIGAAATFSIGLVLAGRLGAEGMPPAWIMLVSRTVGLTVIVLPLVVSHRFRLTRAALPLVIVSGLLEVFGGGIYVVAASQDVAIAAVVSSQFAALAAIGGFLLFGERLQRLQLVGIALVAAGVTVLAALPA
jgi:drug/metabolite transporter (DMT)-like permease